MKPELGNFVGRPCKSRLAFEFVPTQQYSLDLEEMAKTLRDREVLIEIETPYLLMLKHGGHDISLFKSGKIIVKSTNNEHEARKVAEKLVEKMEN